MAAIVTLLQRAEPCSGAPRCAVPPDTGGRPETALLRTTVTRARGDRAAARQDGDGRGDGGEMDNERLARTWMIVAGVALLGAGLIGFIPNNPIASEDPNALFRTNTVHDIVHIVSGLLALGIAFGLRGRQLADGTIGFGVLYAVVGILLIVDPKMFGLMSDAPVNAPDHVLHAGLAIVSIVLGYMARERTTTAATA